MVESDPQVGLSPASDALPATDPTLAAVRGFPTAAGPVDLFLHVGDVVHVAGPNGSGKTSLLRALAGLPSAVMPASCLVAGHDPARLPAAELTRLVHLAPQDARDGLVGLTVAGEFRLRGLTTPADLASLLDRDVATLSSGESRRVALAVAAYASARSSADSGAGPGTGAGAGPGAGKGAGGLLLLDEPAEGLDAAGRQNLAGLVRRHAQHGAVVVTDHAD